MNNCHLECAKHCYLLRQKPKVIFRHLQLLPPVHCQRGQPGVSPGLQSGSSEHERTKRRGGGEEKRGARGSGREFVRNKARLPFILPPHSPTLELCCRKRLFACRRFPGTFPHGRRGDKPGGGFTRPSPKKP